ncbi:3-hydroxybutyryl-CoA dehydrogenase [Salimicrobium humidisoli]|uniref:3-hydroxybutyryl-CoA dehydrogenase n=1 Tax=Salimicrobium humidisoli TaxID=2029857 RepID=A0ABX4HT43_9BACI|nr:3-hydroxybutyryl-CoA dehydrogenase [Salimicrobium humidisoli]PBB06389.1 3-hydroxybutyryl-CoA dehydrogenase [Salimicrobium humidisoli]
MKNIFVIGAGQMGAGIAQVFASHNFSVKLFDVNEEALKKGIEGIYKRLDRAVEKERMTKEGAEQAKAHLETASSMEDAAHCDFAIEAVVERMDVKEKVFRQLDDIMPDHAILATNTSSLPITDVAAVTNRPSQVIGMHFMNPVPVMKLVEIIRAIQTSDETYERVEKLAEQLAKTPVEVNDYPGFVSNRVLMPMINEAVFTVYEGVASKEDVDTVMKLGMNHPMGPLQLADFIGLDTCLSIMEILYDGFGDSKYRPCPLLKKYVAAGWLGKKSGRGFYVYE